MNTDKCLQDLFGIGVTRFELAISRPPDERFTRLSHTPKVDRTLQTIRAIRKMPFRASTELRYYFAMYPANSSCKHDHYLNTCDE